MYRKTPQAISTEAQRFFESAEPLQPWNLDDIEALRAENEPTREDNAATIDRYVQSLEEIDINGVTTLVITPKSLDAKQTSKALLYFFGGAFVIGSPYADLPIAASIAGRLGIKVYAPFYRRAPEYPCPAAIDDGFAVYQHLVINNDASNIVVMGESAGGNLTLAVTLRARQENLAMPAATALLSPWCDVTPTGESQQQPAGFDPTMDFECHLRVSAAAYAGTHPHDDPLVSPLYADYSRGFPATVITTGTREGFLSDCARLSTKMRLAGIDVRLHVWEGMWHVFEWYREIPEAAASLHEIAAFLADQLRRS